MGLLMCVLVIVIYRYRPQSCAAGSASTNCGTSGSGSKDSWLKFHAMSSSSFSHNNPATVPLELVARRTAISFLHLDARQAVQDESGTTSSVGARTWPQPHDVTRRNIFLAYLNRHRSNASTHGWRLCRSLGSASLAFR
jgi:hypothetical protein